MKKYDVVALGEVLIDFTFAGKNADGKNLYEENPGGAPANCAAAVAKLGGSAAFIGMTGRDSFGEDIRAALKEINVDTAGIAYTEKQHTTLAFVSLNEKGERSFSFCRKPGADTQLSVEDLNKDILESAKFLQIGSLSLTDQPSKSAEEEAIKIVKAAGGFISYDPNYRKNLWGNRSDAIDIMKSIFPFADMVKVSDEELVLLYGKGVSYEYGANEIHKAGVKLVLVTLGSKGVYYSAKTGNFAATGIMGVPDVKVADTTGAGDSFTGGLLYALSRHSDIFDFTKESLESDIKFANAVASLCVTKRGAIPALPTLKEVQDFMSKY